MDIVEMATPSGIILAQWSALGDLLIVMLDANQDVRFGALAQVFGELDMINAMYDPSLPLFHQPVLPTGPGHLPIDGIFVSRSIYPSLRGYTDQGEQL